MIARQICFVKKFFIFLLAPFLVHSWNCIKCQEIRHSSSNIDIPQSTHLKKPYGSLFLISGGLAYPFAEQMDTKSLPRIARR